MLATFRHVLLMIAGGGAFAGIGYCFLCMWAGAVFSRRRLLSRPPDTDLPPISILKPLKGADPQMYEALRSHCVQDYPRYEILFGITDANDPAAAVVERLVGEFPLASIRLLVCKKCLGTNRKVSTLAQLVAHAHYDFLLVNDGDIRVEADYLQTVARELSQPQAGMVTCLYRGVPGNTIWSRLEALGIATDFAAGVLAAWRLEGGLRFGLGSTLVFRQVDLAKIGGFEVLADYLADDYELGKRFGEQNLKVELSQAVVETYLPDYDLSGFISHQLRWARTIRTSRPAGYVGLLLTFALPWALLAFALGQGILSGALLAAALLARYAMATILTRRVLRDRRSFRLLWLIPVRDVIAIVAWIGGLFGRKITWRGEVFHLSDGKLQKP